MTRKISDLTAEEKSEILKMHSQGEKTKSLAARFDIDKTGMSSFLTYNRGKLSLKNKSIKANSFNMIKLNINGNKIEGTAKELACLVKEL